MAKEYTSKQLPDRYQRKRELDKMMWIIKLCLIRETDREKIGGTNSTIAYPLIWGSQRGIRLFRANWNECNHSNRNALRYFVWHHEYNDPIIKFKGGICWPSYRWCKHYEPGFLHIIHLEGKILKVYLNVEEVIGEHASCGGFKINFGLWKNYEGHDDEELDYEF